MSHNRSSATLPTRPCVAKIGQGAPARPLIPQVGSEGALQGFVQAPGFMLELVEVHEDVRQAPKAPSASVLRALSLSPGNL